MKKALYISVGFACVLLGGIGVVLPLLPTTPFLILASACFAKSSDRFHQMLLNNQWFGDDLKHWQQHKAISRQSKKRAILLIILSFSLSITVLHHRLGLQILLFGMAALLLWIVWRLKE